MAGVNSNAGKLDACRAVPLLQSACWGICMISMYVFLAGVCNNSLGLGDEMGFLISPPNKHAQLLNLQLVMRPHVWLCRSYQALAQVGYRVLVNLWCGLLSRTATLTTDGYVY